MAKSVLAERTKEFARDVVFMCQGIRNRKQDIILTNQLLKSGTSIGANVHEANYAHSKADFVSKRQIALKECYETEYWLDLLFDTEYIGEAEYKKMRENCGSIRRMLVASCITVKENTSS